MKKKERSRLQRFTGSCLDCSRLIDYRSKRCKPCNQTLVMKNRPYEKKINSGCFKKGMTPWSKGKENPYIKGELNPSWKGGVTSENEIIRRSGKMHEWRKAVFERDNYTCQDCGIRSEKGVKAFLHADHIEPFAYFPKLRFELSNGRTLCLDCHLKTPTWGERAKKLYEIR